MHQTSAPVAVFCCLTFALFSCTSNQHTGREESVYDLAKLREQTTTARTTATGDSILQDAYLSSTSDRRSRYIFDLITMRDFGRITAKVQPVIGASAGDVDETAPVVGPNGALYFARSALKFTTEGEDVYRIERGTIPKPHRVGPPISTAHANAPLFFSGDTLYFYGQLESAFRTARLRGVTVPLPTIRLPNAIPRIPFIVFSYDPATDSPFFEYPVATPRARLIMDHEEHFYRVILKGLPFEERHGDVYRAVPRRSNQFAVLGEVKRPISTHHWESDYMRSPDGKAIVLASDRTSGGGNVSIKRQKFLRDEFTTWGNTDLVLIEPQWIGTDSQFVFSFPINTKLSERTPSFSSSGDTLFFSSNGLPGYGGFDVFYCVRVDSGSYRRWSSPINMGPGVNSAGNDLWYREATDGKLYMASDRTGSFDIYNVTLYSNVAAALVTDSIPCSSVLTGFAIDTEDSSYSRTIALALRDPSVPDRLIRSDRVTNYRVFDLPCLDSVQITLNHVLLTSDDCQESPATVVRSLPIYFSSCEVPESVINSLTAALNRLVKARSYTAVLAYSSMSQQQADAIQRVLGQYGISVVTRMHNNPDVFLTLAAD